MEVTLSRFVRALRRADVEVSPAETLDAFAVAQKLGIVDRDLLRNGLALVLAKSREDKERFVDCFDRFFDQLAFREAPRGAMLKGVVQADLLARLEAASNTETRSLIELALADDRSLLSWQLTVAAESLEIERMSSLRDKRILVERLLAMLGMPGLELALQSQGLAGEHQLLGALRYVRQYLREQVQAFIDDQYALIVDASGRRALVEAALAANLDQLPPGYHEDAARVVHKLAEQLLKSRRRRQRQRQRGALDIRRSLRENIAYDGALFKLRWRERKVEKATVFVVCDLSGSVSRIARFLLTFLHDLADALPDMRIFGFSSRLGEMTESFRRFGAERAVEEAILAWGRGTTDYGRALLDLREAIHSAIDHRSTLIILGDARRSFARIDVEGQTSRSQHKS